MKIRRPIPTRGGLEFETFCRCRQCKRSLRPQTRRWAKRAYWKRARRAPLED